MHKAFKLDALFFICPFSCLRSLIELIRPNFFRDQQADIYYYISKHRSAFQVIMRSFFSYASLSFAISFIFIFFLR